MFCHCRNNETSKCPKYGDSVATTNNVNEVQKEEIKGNDKPWYHLLIGYALLLLTASFYMIAVISAQIIVDKTNIFVVNLYKFICEGAICLVVIIYTKKSLKPDRNAGPYWITTVIAEVFFSIFFFLAASLMPAGNNEATFTAAYIVITTSFDLFKKKTSKLAAPASLVILLGMICLIQPWQRDLKEVTSIVPCECIENRSMCAVTHDPLHNQTTNTASASNAHLPNEYVGYVLAIIAALAGAVYSNVVKYATEETPLFGFLFWVYVSVVIVFLPITGITSYFMDVHFHLPTGTVCFIFTLTFIVGSATATVVCMIMFQYLPVSAGGQAWPLVTTVLYICQRTFLRRFHPGHSNVSEVAGIVLINIGAILSTVVVALHETKKLPF